MSPSIAKHLSPTKRYGLSTQAKTMGALFVCPFLLVTTACRDDGSGGGGSAGNNGSLTLDQLSEKLKDIACAQGVECHRFETEAECFASMSFNIPNLMSYSENNTVIYHPEKVDACIAVFAAFLSCSYSQQIAAIGDATGLTACNAVFEGTVVDGASCFDNTQCVSEEDATRARIVWNRAAWVPAPPACLRRCWRRSAKPASMSMSIVNRPGIASKMGNPTTCATKKHEGSACTDFGTCIARGDLPARLHDRNGHLHQAGGPRHAIRTATRWPATAATISATP